MELSNFIQSRRSVRAFKSTPVSKELIEQVFGCAQSSPSYANSQPWEVVVVTGQTRDSLSRVLYDLAQAEVTIHPDIPTPASWPAHIDERVKEHGARRFKALGIERTDAQARNHLRLMNFEFFGAPCAAFFMIDEALDQWSAMDVGMYVQTTALSLHAHGLSSCLQASLAYYPNAVREHLSIPPSKKILLGMSFGYADEEAPINAYQSARVELQRSLTIYG
jgi:nitroreductase